MPAESVRLSTQLPEFPWDTLQSAKRRAAAHPDGLVDLSIGTPVDPTPANVQVALAASADAPGYPTVAGTTDVRDAIVEYLVRRCGARLGHDAVLPTIGSKELVASLPAQLGIGPGDVVVIPQICYPTYEVGALLAGASVLRADSTVAAGPQRVALVWLNSPANPTGRVLPADHLRKAVGWARERDAVLAVDECYFELAWEGTPVSVLDPGVNGGSLANVLAVHSLSKRSNLAGYRAGFVAGDPAVVAELLAVRKHLGLMVPAPVQAAMCAALRDDEHASVQRERYRVRRERLRSALEAAGFRIDCSEGALYLWASRDEPCGDTVDALSDLGILVAPVSFYGPAGDRHVRVALTATDERVGAACARLDPGPAHSSVGATDERFGSDG
jgi:succinyldiaminopimelate transaminase